MCSLITVFGQRIDFDFQTRNKIRVHYCSVQINLTPRPRLIYLNCNIIEQLRVFYI